MRYDIDSYINSIVKDNKYCISESGCQTIADYIIESAESTNLWNEFFDDKELDGDATCEQIEEFKKYLRGNWNNIVACECYYTYYGKEVFLAAPSEMPEDIKPISNECNLIVKHTNSSIGSTILKKNGMDATEANADPRVTYLESYCGHYADGGEPIMVAKIVNQENEEHYLYDWILVSDLEDVNEGLNAKGFDENDIPNEFLSEEDYKVLDNIKKYELSMSNTDVDYQFTRIICGGDVKLYLFQFGCGIKSSAIAYSDGTTFVLSDWQGSRPETFDEIEDYDWVLASDGRKAIILNGLPRVL